MTRFVCPHCKKDWKHEGFHLDMRGINMQRHELVCIYVLSGKCVCVWRSMWVQCCGISWWSNSHPIHRSTIWPLRTPSEIGVHPPLPNNCLISHPPHPTQPHTHTDNYINFQPPQTHTHSYPWPWMTNPNKFCLRGKMEESRGGADKLERTGRRWMEETRKKGRKIGGNNASVIVWMIYGDQRCFWGNALHACSPSEGFFQQIWPFPGDFQNKWWWDRVARTQNWGKCAHANTTACTHELFTASDHCLTKAVMFCALHCGRRSWTTWAQFGNPSKFPWTLSAAVTMTGS